MVKEHTAKRPRFNIEESDNRVMSPLSSKVESTLRMEIHVSQIPSKYLTPLCPLFTPLLTLFLSSPEHSVGASPAFTV